MGTVGYAAPEYVQTGRLTAKSDVWSFGVVLYELITGRRAVDRNLPRSEQKLLEWVKPYVSDSKKFHIIVDPRLQGDFCPKSAQRLATVANKCLMRQPRSRPKMSEVVEMLGQIIDSLDDSTCPKACKSKKHKDSVDIMKDDVPSTEGFADQKRFFDLKDRIRLRNRTMKLDWRAWTPGLVRTW